MGESTKIEWTDATWSPWHGCSKVSDGCRYCYAETLSKRNPGVLGVWGPHGTRVVNADWKKPLAWNRKAEREGRRIRVFPSLCDPFENRADLDEPRIRFLHTIEQTKNIDWLLLTKRPENVMPLLRHLAGPDHNDPIALKYASLGLPRNVWLGISAENQDRADERIPKLPKIPAETRWLSLEPLLGPIDVYPWIRRHAVNEEGECDEYCCMACRLRDNRGLLRDSAIHWVVVGGESGKDARPCNLEWIRSIVRQCKDAGVPCFVKQLGKSPQDPGPEAFDWESEAHSIMVRHPKGGDPAEWPEDLQVRDLPEGWF